ncbi:glycosyl hydrolase [Hymenobacter jejuensis]|uniref:Glycosyl hydrolase n=2 Tax=Hymenobacter jejuensis TaxID=2502781 RepID=A0A5B7ZXW6_9BACT|nr:glycosyl hydrolase [Hymenobacter jejuensis]
MNLENKAPASDSSLRALAIYLPQFHPIPENDAWWGKGFTEWTNVTKARPRFPGHYQPQLPADLGFYDLRLAETREQQASMAREYGIHGFVYYHYWFNGRRILERPFEEVLKSGQPDFPFCLCWANENWSRRWDGQELDVLLRQTYSEDDDLNHIRYLAPMFADPRYIRVDGKPVFIVYRMDLFPNIKRTTDIWRNEAHRLGIGDLYLIQVDRVGHDGDLTATGFDAAMEFHPDYHHLPMRYVGKYKDRFFNKTGLYKPPYYKDNIYEYEKYIQNAMSKAQSKYKLFPGVTPDWDNSARRKQDATIFLGSTPELYENWLRDVVKKFKPYSKEENFIFINAWNEWAEGNHLEPCQKWGRQYLEATLNALNNGKSQDI